MRINKYVAASSALSRRAADTAILEGRVLVNGKPPATGQEIGAEDIVSLDGQRLILQTKQTILFHKPTGYVTSRNGQGSKTIYDLLPPEVHHLKPVGRLDKDSSGLLLLTNDGDLAQQLTHPGNQKTKIYEVQLDKALAPLHRQMISEIGLQLEDGPSQLLLNRLKDDDDQGWKVTMHEGRNRQIRRTFAALGYEVVQLHRTQFGNYRLGSLPSGEYKTL